MGWWKKVTEIREVCHTHANGQIVHDYVVPEDKTHKEIFDLLPAIHSQHPYVDNMRVTCAQVYLDHGYRRMARVTWEKGHFVQKPSMEVVWEVC